MTDILDVILDNLEEKHRSIRDAVCVGKVQDWSEYKRLCGIMHGLDFAREYIEDLKIRLNGDDNDR
jgi:hypothetical protein